MNTNKCPHCKAIIGTVVTEDITMTIGAGKPAWNGFSHACPDCHAVLGVEVNPMTIQSEIIDAIHALGKGR
jgi:phage FluMu protein Com